jgi:hypothetical protein
MDRLTGSSALAVEVQVLRAGAAESEARIKALEEALRPFADAGATLGAEAHDDSCWADLWPGGCITFGHLRRAFRALLKEADQ